MTKETESTKEIESRLIGGWHWGWEWESAVNGHKES